jgi:hypothetical protein
MTSSRHQMLNQNSDELLYKMLGSALATAQIKSFHVVYKGMNLFDGTY